MINFNFTLVDCHSLMFADADVFFSRIQRVSGGRSVVKLYKTMISSQHLTSWLTSCDPNMFSVCSIPTTVSVRVSTNHRLSWFCVNQSDDSIYLYDRHGQNSSCNHSHCCPRIIVPVEDRIDELVAGEGDAVV